MFLLLNGIEMKISYLSGIRIDLFPLKQFHIDCRVMKNSIKLFLPHCRQLNFEYSTNVVTLSYLHQN